MKLTAIFLLIGCLHLSAKGLAQNISLSGKNMSLEEVLSSISKQSGYFFLYKYNEVRKASPVTLQLKNVPLKQALETSFKGQPFSYRIESNTIVVTEIESVEKSHMFQITVTGSVKDQNGVALPGATIRVKGSPLAAVADINGNFTIRGIESNAVLLISFTGFTSLEVALSGRSAVEVVLREDLQNLNEVVVVGYGTQKKLNVTGSVSSITARDIANRPVTTVSSALQGLLPGVTVVNSTALPGDNRGTIRIRGVGTLNDPTPLYVIDGIPGGDIGILNPDDIESISVLKDAASSSIYGVRGANGVILVTTKKGKSGGEPTFGYSNYFGFQTPTALPERIGSVEYMELLNESRRNVDLNPTYTDDQIEIARSGSDPNYYANTDWVDAIMKDNAPQQNHAFNLSGASKNLNYYLSYGYLKEGGLVTGDNYKANRHNVRARLNTTLMDRLDIDANIGYIDRSYSGSSWGIAAGGGPIYAAMQILPLVPVRFTTGGWGYIGGQSNPVATATDGGWNRFGSQEITTNLQATLRLFNGFRLRAQYGMVKSNSKRNIFTNTVNYYSPEDGARIYQTNPVNKIDARDYTSTYQTFIGMAEYERTFNKAHFLKGMLAVSRDESISDNFTASRTHLPTPDVPNLNVGTQNQLNTGDATSWALQSFFGRLNYSFRDKYLLEGNFRYDGSSKFLKDLRYEWFGSASLGWVFSEEAFFQPLRKYIDVAKVRFSYGTQGNDRLSENFGYLSVMESVTTMPLGNELLIAYRPGNVPNPLLTWESMEKQNIGLDLSLLRNRLGVTADYYINKTDRILMRVPLPDVIGVRDNEYPFQNAGKVENKGWELQLNWQDKIKEFQYGASFNLSDVRNKVTGYGGVLPTYGDRIRVVGEPIDAFYGLVADGIAQEADFDFDPVTSVYTPKFPFDASYPPAPGDLKFKDLNNDGAITLADDRQVIGSAIPRYTFGFRGNVAWKGIDFQFFLQGVGKADGLIQGAARHALINEGSMPQRVHLDRWTPENTDASYPRLTYNKSYNQRLSTYWLEDASYLRLKNIQLGYTIPARITEKLRVSRLRVYASADNIFTKTDFFYGYDPESPISSGGFYPQVKTFVFGLNVNFK